MLVRVAASAAAIAGVGGVAHAQVVTSVAPDGRTQTNVAANGAVTTVTTQTMSGANALNSFSSFDVGNGSTVNLVVPDSAHMLVNIVRDRAVTIEGVVNSLQHGAIGGNVFFADPHGFVVGKSGSINVGSLTVATPTAAFLDTVLDARGGIGGAALASLLAGDMPLSSDGTISIHGAINAGAGVRLQGETVTANGTITAGLAGHDALFAQAVNTSSMVVGSRLVETDGRIEIVADTDAAIGGTLTAPSAIDMRAGRDILLAGGTTLAADAGASGKGGTIAVIAGRDLTAADGLGVSARGGAAGGDGGAVELSAARGETLGAATYDLTAANGATGTLLFDPASLDISANQSTNGAAYTMAADTLHLLSGVTINTTNGAAQAGAITLTGTAITLDGTLNAGAGTTAGAVSVTASSTSDVASTSFGTSNLANASLTVGSASVINGGAVTLAVAAENTTAQGIASATAALSVAGQVTGTTVSITADAAATTHKNSAPSELVTAGLQQVKNVLGDVPYVQSALDALGTASVPLDSLGYSSATANATVSLLSTARITAGTGGAVLRSTASQNLDKVDASGVGLGVVFAKIAGGATTDVASGASISSGGKLEIASHDGANGKLPVSVSSGDVAGDITVAVLKSDISATSIVHTGSTISAAGDLSVIGRNDTNYDVEATSSATGGAKLGIAAALSFTTANATALLGVSVGTGAVVPTNVLVEADSIGANSIVKADSGAGTAAQSEVSGISDWSSLVDTFQSTLFEKYLGKLFSSSDGASPKLSSALAVNDGSATTRAEIAPTDAATAAPTVKAGTSVAVVANRVDGGILTSAKSEVESTDKKSGTTYAVSAAIDVGLRTNTTLALVAPNAVVTAGKVAVQANLALPKPYGWASNSLLSGDFSLSDAFSDGVVSGITDLYNDIKDLTDPSAFVTGFAESKGQGSSGSVNGVVNYFGRTDATTAWVGNGAKITATDATGNTGWQVNADAGDAKLMLDATTAAAEIAGGANPLTSPTAGGVFPTLSFAKSATVAAGSDASTFFLSGDRSSIKAASGSGSGGTTGAVGGVVNMTEVSNATTAGVAATAQVTSAGDVAVAATSSNTSYLIDPGAGTGASIGVTGIVALADLTEATHASIANSAVISAPVVSVTAGQGVNLWTATGAVSTGKAAGVGLSVSVNRIATDTSAIVGDNAADATAASAIDSHAGSSSSAVTGSIAANSLSVHADTHGQAGALSIALASASQGPPGKLSQLVAGAKGKFQEVSDKIDGVKSALDPLLNPISALLDQSGDTASTTGQQQSADSTKTPSASSSGKSATDSGKDGFSLGIAGAASVGLYGANTTASVSHVALNPYGSGASIATDVLATRNASFFTLAGGGVKVGAGDGGGSAVGVAGALALTEDSGNTLATMDTVTAAKAGATNVQALSNGETIGVGLSADVATGQNSAAIAASGTLSFLHGATNADVANSNLTGVGAVDLRVRGYNSTQVGLGAGGFYKGGKGGLGATLTLSLVSDSSGVDPITGAAYNFVGAHLVNTTASFGHVGVEAEAPIRLISAAATAGAATGPNGVSIALGGVYSDIGRSISATVSGSILTATAVDANSAACGDETCGVLVLAGADRVAALDTIIGNPTASAGSDMDFTASAANGALGVHPSGAAIISAAGIFTFGRVAAGLEFAGGNIHDNYVAKVSASKITATNSDVAVLTHDSAYIGALSVGAAVSTGNPGLAFMGSATVNLISSSDSASITGGTLSGATPMITAKAVTVDADAAAAIDSLAGNIAGGTGTAIGVAVGFNQIGRSIGSSVSGLEISAPLFATQAEAAGHIRTLAAAGALATGSSPAVAGSFTINNLSDSVSAVLGASTNVSNANSGSYTTVAATNSGRIDALAGGVGVSTGSAGVGVAVAVNLLSGSTSASVDGATIKSADLDVLANATGNVGVIAVGAGVGQSAGVGGSIVTNILSNSTKATIDAGATVTAANSVSVQAANSAGVYVASGAIGGGSSAGVGLGVATNILGATTQAQISGAAVTAAGGGNGRSVSTGTLTTPIDVSTLMDLTPSADHSDDGAAYSTLFIQHNGDASDPVTQMKSFGYATKTVNGLSVNATTSQNVAVLAAAVGVSGTAAISANIGTSVVSGTTKAEIVNSTVDGAAGQHGAVDVTASGSTLVGNILAAVSGSGNVAVAGAAAAASFKQSVTADVVNSAIGTSGTQAQAVAINAIGNQQSFGLVAGISLGGQLAFAGSGAVNIFNSDTTALLSGQSVYARSLAVNANTFDAVGAGVGAIAVGFGSGAGAGAFDVTYMRDRTTASVGTSDLATATSLTINGDITVHAEGHDRFSGLAVSGAGGLWAGISGLANILYEDSAVRAGLYDATVAHGAGHTIVSSLIETSMSQYGGAIGGGAVGVGLALNLAIVKDAATAEVVGSTIDTAQLDVTADKTRAISATTLSAGVGLGAAGGAINLALIGALGTGGLADSDSGDLSSSSSLSAMTGNADAMSSSDLSGNNKSLSASQRSAASTATSTGVASSLTNATIASTTARVLNSTVKTSGALTVAGTVASSTSATVGGLAAGGIGVGGAVGFTRLRDSVAATISNDAGHSINAGSIAVNAVTKDGSGGASAKVNAYAGAAGVVGLGASVADVDVKNVVTASVGGTVTGTSGGTLTIGATDSTTQAAVGAGAAVGASAAGLSAGVVNRASAITAGVDANSVVSLYNSTSIGATDSGSASATSYAAAGGVFNALSGAVATAIDNSSVTAQIGSGAVTTTGGGGLSLTATGSTGLTAEADGIAISGELGVGLSVATATANQTVSALDAAAGHTGGGAIAITASLTTSGPISALARAAAGGVLAGAQGSAAYARNTAHIDAEYNAGSNNYGSSGIPTAGAVTVQATNNNAVSADSEGLVAGAFAAGAVFSEADANSTTTAKIGDGAGAVTTLGAVSVKATSTDTTTSYALSGSGGIVAGAAAGANTSNASHTYATIGARPVTASGITLAATHTANYAGAADAKQAAAAGASGAIVINSVTATTTTSVGANAALTAAQMAISALNVYGNAALPHGESYAGVGGAGGLANIGAVSVNTTLGGTARTQIGGNAALYVIGNPITILQAPAGALGTLTIDAATRATTNDAATLEMGGAFQGPFAGVSTNSDFFNQVDVGAGAVLHSDGRIGIGAQNYAQQYVSAEVKVYGLAAAGGGKTNITTNSTQTVTIGANADLLSYGDMTIGAGVTSDGSTTNYTNTRADTHVYNNTVVPITAILDANATSNADDTLTIANGARLRSVLDVTLTSTQGDVTAKGAYVGSNPYLTLFSSDTTGGNSNTTGTGALALGGVVTAGVANKQSLTVSGQTVNATSSLNDDNSPTRFFPSGSYVAANATDANGNRIGFTPLDDISTRITNLTAERNAAGTTADRQTAIDGEVTLLNALYGDLYNIGASNGLSTIQTGQIYAAGGDITIKAATISKIANSGAALNAQGDASVTITNPTGASLLIGEIYMPTSGSGVVKYTGAATAAGTGIAIGPQGSGAAPALSIINSQDSAAPGATGAGTSVFLASPIYNPTGTTTITNLSGSIAQFAPITTSQLTMNAPNGSFFVNQAGIWNEVDPASEWSILPVSNYWDFFGITHLPTTGDAFGIVDYATNFIYNRYGQYNTDTLARALIGNGITNYRVVGILPNNKNDDNDSGYTHGVGGGLPFRVGGYGENQYSHYYGPYGDDSWYLLNSAPLAVSTRQTASASQENSSGVAASSIDVGRSVIINAGTININAGITAGHATTQSVTLTADAQTYINQYNAYLQTGVLPTQTINIGFGTIQVPVDPSYFSIVNGMLSLDGYTGTGTGAIRASYDARGQIAGVANPNAGKIVLANVDASGGGSITLNGRIINTDGLGFGNLNVRSGLGQVSINNQTSTGIVVGTISTGTGDQDGTIKITDRNFTNSQGGALTQWWVNPQGTNYVFHYSNQNTGGKTTDTAQLFDVGYNRAATYNPMANQRYAWDDTYQAQRTLTYPTTDWTTPSVSAWTITGGTNHNDYARSTAYVETGSSSDPFFVSQVTNAYLNDQSYSVGWHHYLYEKGGDLTVATYHVATYASLTVHNSIKADNAIGLHFIGNNSAGISINSLADVTFAGDVSNPLGNLGVGVASPWSIYDRGATLTSASYTFNAGGNVGTSAAPIMIASATGATPTLNATSTLGNIVITNTAGAVQIGKVTASTGDVTLSSTNGFVAQPVGTAANITARTLTLAAGDGAIGTLATPLSFYAKTVNASASGDVNLSQTVGNMIVGNMTSSLGTINLIAQNGTVVGGAPTAAAVADKTADDTARWDRLGLTASTAGQAAVTQYTGSVDAAYARYWDVKSQLATGSTTALTDAGRALFRSQAAAILGVDSSTLSNADIDATMIAAMASAKTVLTTAFAADPVVTGAPDPLAAKQANFHYTIATTDSRYTAITTGAKWDVGQLSNTVGGASGTATGANLQAQTGISITSNNPTQPANLTVNVTVNGAATSYYVVTGAGTGYTTSDNDADATHYSSSQVKSLLAASGGAASHTSVNANTVQFALGNTATVSTRTQTGVTNVVSNADFHLDITGDASLNSLTSTIFGTLFVNASGNILNGDTSHISTVGGLSLTAGGYAGTDAAPLLFAAASPAAPLRITSITAGGGVSLKVVNAGIALGDTSFTGTATIAASGAIGSYAGSNGAATISGHGGLLTLRTDLANSPLNASIGTSSQPFTLVDTDATAIALVTRSATLAAPTISGATTPTGDVTLAASTIDNALAVTAGGAIDWRAGDTGTISAQSATLTAGGAIGTSAPVKLDIASGAIQSSGTATGTSNVAVSLTNSRAGGGVTLTAIGATGGGLIVAGTTALGLGTVTARDAIALSTTSGAITAAGVTANTGNVTISGPGAFTAGSLTAAAGSVAVNTTGLISLTNVASGGALGLTSAGGINVTHQINGGTGVALNAGGDIGGGAEVDSGGAATLRGVGITVGAASVAARFDAQATGGLTLTNGTAEGFTLKGTTVNYGDLTATDLATTIFGTGAIVGGTFASGADIGVTGASLVATALQGANVTANVIGAATLQGLSTTGSGSLHAGSASIDTVNTLAGFAAVTGANLTIGSGFGSSMSLTAGSLDFTELSVGGTLGASVVGNITGGSISRSGTTTLAGATIALDALYATTATVAAAGRFTSGVLVATNAASIGGSGITIGSTTAQVGTANGTNTIQVGALTLHTGGDVAILGDASLASLDAHAGTTIDFTGHGITAGSALSTVQAGGTITGGSLTTTGLVQLNGDRLAIGTLSTGWLTATLANAAIVTTLTTAGDAQFTAGSATIATGTIGGGLAIRTTNGVLSLGTVSANGMTLVSGDAIGFGALSGTGSLSMTASRGTITGQGVTGFATGTIVGSGLSLVSYAGGALVATTTGSLLVGGLTLSGSGSFTGGTVELDGGTLGGLLSATSSNGAMTLGAMRAAGMGLISAGTLGYGSLDLAGGGLSARATGAIGGGAIGNVAAGTLTGASLAATSYTGASLSATMTGLASIGTLTTTGAAGVKGDGVSLTHAGVGTTLTATSTASDIVLGDAAAQAMALTSARDASFTSLTGTGGGLSLTAARNASGTSVTGFGAATVGAASLSLATLRGASASVTTSGNTGIATLATTGAASVTGGTVSLTNASAGGTLAATTTTGDLTLGNASAAGMTLSSAGAVTFASLTGTGTGSPLSLSAAAAIGGTGTTSIAGFGAASVRGGSLAVTTLTGGGADVVTTGLASIGMLTTSGAASVKGGSVSLTHAAAGTTLAATSTGTDVTIGDATAQAITLGAARDLAFTTLTGTGGNLSAMATRTITGQSATGFAGNAVTAGTLSLATLRGTTATVATTGLAGITTLATTGDASVIGGSASLTGVSAGGSLAVTTVTGDLTLGSANAAGMTLSSAGGVTFTTLSGTGTATPLSLSAIGAVGGTSVTGFGAATLRGASLGLTALTGVSADVITTGLASIGTLTTSGAASVKGDGVSLTHSSVGTSLTATSTGSDVTLGDASAAAMTLNAARDVVFTSLSGTGSLSMTASRGTITGQGVTGFATGTIVGSGLSLVSYAGGALVATTTGSLLVGGLTLSGSGSFTGGTVELDGGTLGGLLSATSSNGAMTLGAMRAAGMGLISAGTLGYGSLDLAGGGLSARATGAIGGGAIGNVAAGTLTGASLAATSYTGASLSATMTGLASIGTLTTTGAAGVKGDGVSLTHAGVGTTLTATSTASDIVLGDAAAQAMALTSARDASFTSLTGTGGGLSLTAARNASGTSVTGFGAATVGAASLSLATLRGASASVTTSGNTGIATLATTGAASVTGGTVSLTNASAGGTLAATTTTGDLTLGNASAAGMTLSSAGAVTFASLTGTGTGSPLSLSAAAAIGGTGTTSIAGFGAASVRGGSLAVTTLTGGGADVVTTGLASIGMLTTSGAASVKGGSVSLTHAAAGTTLAATSTGTDVTIGDATAQAITLGAARDLAFTTLTGTGALSATAGRAIAGQTIGGFATNGVSGASLTIGSLDGGTLTAATTGQTRIDAAHLAQNAGISAGNLTSTTLTVDGALTATTLIGDAAFGAVTTHAATLASAGAMTFATLTGTGGDLSATATGAIGGAGIAGFGANLLTAASVQLATLAGTSATVATSGATMIGDAALAGAARFVVGGLTLSTGEIGAGLVATSTLGDLSLGISRAAAMTLTSAHDLAFTSLTGSGGGLAGVVANAVNGGTVSGFGDANLGAATLSLASLSGTTAELAVNGAASVTTLTTTSDATLRAATMTLGTTTTGGTLAATTTGGALALGATDARAATLASAGTLGFTTLTGHGGALAATVAGAANGTGIAGFASNGLTAASLQLGGLAGGSAAFATTGATAVGATTLTGNGAFSASTLALTTATTGGALTATSTGGDLTLGTAQALAMTLASAGNLSAGTLTGQGGALAATIAGGFTGHAVSGFAGNAVTAATLTLDTLAGGSFQSTTSGATGIGALTTSGDATLRGAVLTLGPVQVGTMLAATSTTGDVTLVDAQATAMTLTSAHDIGYASLRGTGALVATAANALHGATITGFASGDLAGTTVSLDAVTIGGALGVAGTDVTLGSAQAGNATIRAGGNLGVTQLTTGGATSLTGATTRLGTVTAGTALTAGSSGTLDATTLRAATIALTSGGTATLDTATATGALSVASADLVARTLTAGGAMALTGRDLTVTTTVAGGAMTGGGRALSLGTVDAASIALDATGAVGFARTGSGGATRVTAQGDVRGTTLIAGGNAVVAGANVSLDTVQASGLVQVTSAGTMTIGKASVTGLATSTPGTLRTQAVPVGAMTLAAGGALNAQSLTSDGGIQATARAMTIAAATSGGDLTGRAATSLALTDGKAGGVMTLAANGGDLTATTLAAGLDASLTATGKLTLASLGTGGNAALNAGGAMAADTVRSGGAAALTAGGALTTTLLTTVTSAALGAGGNLTALTLNAGGAATLNAGGTLATTTLTAGTNAALIATGALTSGAITAGQAATLGARSIGFGTIDAASLAASSSDAISGRRASLSGDATIAAIGGAGATVSIDTLSARTVAVTASGGGTSAAAPAIRLGSASIGQSLALQGASSAVAVTGTGGALALSLTGYNGARMADAVVRATSAVPLTVTRLSVNDAALSTAGSVLSVLDGAADRLTLATSALSVLVDNRSPSLSYGYTAQYYSPTGRFALNAAGLALNGTVPALWIDQAAGVRLSGAGGFMPATMVAAQQVETGEQHRKRVAPKPPVTADAGGDADPVQGEPGAVAVNTVR